MGCVRSCDETNVQDEIVFYSDMIVMVWPYLRPIRTLRPLRSTPVQPWLARSSDSKRP
jgi:hypothetical protein